MARVAIRFIILFLEGAFIQLFETEGACKVFRVKLAEHCRDASPGDWFLTAGA